MEKEREKMSLTFFKVGNHKDRLKSMDLYGSLIINKVESHEKVEIQI